MNDDLHSATLSEVARHAGVSLATASRALNGSARTVNAELQARVVASAAALRYTANAQAQAVARGASRTVAVVLGDIADPYFSSIVSGVLRIAEQRGLAVTMAPSSGGSAGELSTLSTLRGQRPQVLIMAGSRHRESAVEAPLRLEFEAFERTGSRVCCIGPVSGDFRSVAVPNRQGAAALATALAGRGYRDFAILAGPSTLVTPIERAGGFVDGLAAAGITVPEDRIIHGPFSRDGGYRATLDLLASGVHPECIFAVTDVMAVGAMSAIRESGFAPGSDIGVAGFDDIQTLQDVTPSLTTFALPLVEIGERALELALADVTGELEKAVEGRVELRESTPGPVRS